MALTHICRDAHGCAHTHGDILAPNSASRSILINDFMSERVNKYEIQHMSPRWQPIGRTKKIKD